MTQSRFMSFAEATTNVVAGYGIAVGTQALVYPLFGLRASLSENFGIAAVFTLVSLVRSFILRRAFETLRSGRCS